MNVSPLKIVHPKQLSSKLKSPFHPAVDLMTCLGYEKWLAGDCQTKEPLLNLVDDRFVDKLVCFEVIH